jgi:hypothetical protein
MTRSKRDKEYNVMLESFGRFVHLFGPFRRSILVDVRSPLLVFAFRSSLFAFVFRFRFRSLIVLGCAV